LGSTNTGSIAVCDQVFFIFLITGNTSNLFTVVYDFYIFQNVFYVFSFVFCCLSSVIRAEVSHLHADKNTALRA